MISEFISSFKKAYKETYAEKIKSKEEIKAIEFLMYEWNDRIQNIKLVIDILSTHSEYLPNIKFKDSNQNLVNLTDMGLYNAEYEFGLLDRYESIYYVVFHDYSDMKNNYKKKNYMRVHEIYNNCIEQVNITLYNTVIQDEQETSVTI